MKNSLIKNYQINPYLFIKISDNVDKIKDERGREFLLKKVKNNDINTIFAHVGLTDCAYLLLPLVNASGSYVSFDQESNTYYYICSWLNEDNVMARAWKLRFYLNTLAGMHRDFSYQMRVNEGFFTDTYNKILAQLDNIALILDQQLQVIEKLDYKSPSQWLLLLNNQQFYQALRKARNHLQLFKEESAKESAIRLTLVYQNFDYSHISIKNKILLSCDKMAFAPAIFDIKHLYDASYKTIIDLSGFEQDYLQYYPLLSYEHHWLLALLLIPPIDFAADNELDKIIKLTKCLYHIRGGLELEKAMQLYKSKKESNNK